MSQEATTTPNIKATVLTIEWALSVDSAMEQLSRRMAFVENVERAFSDFEVRLEQRLQNFESRVAKRLDARVEDEDRQSNVNVHVNLQPPKNPSNVRGSIWQSLKPAARKHKTPIVAGLTALATLVLQALVQYLQTR